MPLKKRKKKCPLRRKNHKEMMWTTKTKKMRKKRVSNSLYLNLKLIFYLIFEGNVLLSFSLQKRV